MRCEVSTEAPNFYTMVESVVVEVSSLPRGPDIQVCSNNTRHTGVLRQHSTHLHNFVKSNVSVVI